MEELRDVYKKVRLRDVKKGDVFRMYEKDGEPVVDNKGKSEWTATSDAHILDSGIWGIDINE